MYGRTAVGSLFSLSRAPPPVYLGSVFAPRCGAGHRNGVPVAHLGAGVAESGIRSRLSSG